MTNFLQGQRAYNSADSLNEGKKLMFRHIIDEYRRTARQQLKDADEMESGRWRVFDFNRGDETREVVTRKRSLASRLLALAGAYEKHES